MRARNQLDKQHQTDYLNILFKELDINNFTEAGELQIAAENSKVKTAAPLDIPDIASLDQPTGAAPAAPAPMGGTPPPMGMEPPPPMGTPPMEGGVDPMNAPPPMGMVPPPPPAAPAPSKEKLEELEDSISNLVHEIDVLKNSIEIRQIKEYINENLLGLKEKIDDLMDRKIPQRMTVDTEGIYKEQLYGLVTEVLDKFLPDLFEELPEYSFLASQLSRTFSDGTVADAIVSVNITVPRASNRYDFKVDVPILNGVINYPQYIYRGVRIIPLTKHEIQREMNSFTHRKMDVETPMEKENTFTNFDCASSIC